MAADGEMEEISSGIGRNRPRDLLLRFASGDVDRSDGPVEVAGGDTGEIELSLGLSLGGCFGVEPKDKRLVRSSSIAIFPVDRGEFPTATRAPLARACSLPAEAPLTRTCSLPSAAAAAVGETEEERRRRKEMQGLKRLEAKRKRSEKRAAAAKDRKEESLDDDNKGEVAGGQFVGKVNGAVVPVELARWAVRAAGGRPMSQGSIGSQGSSASGVSDFESKPMQGLDMSGLSNCAEARSSSTRQAASDHTNHNASTADANQVAGRHANITRDGEEPSKKKKCTTNGVNGAKEMERNMMEEMPCVSTKGDGPNGRRIEGFLYKYRKGEEVRIVCVCHGSFLTPAEFVKHAGGSDVAHPLRHIVVNPTPSAFL